MDALQQELAELRSKLAQYESVPTSESDAIEEAEFTELLNEGIASGNVNDALKSYVQAFAALWERYRKEKIRFQARLIQIEAKESPTLFKQNVVPSTISLNNVQTKEDAKDVVNNSWGIERNDLLNTIEGLREENANLYAKIKEMKSESDATKSELAAVRRSLELATISPGPASPAPVVSTSSNLRTITSSIDPDQPADIAVVHDSQSQTETILQPNNAPVEPDSQSKTDMTDLLTTEIKALERKVQTLESEKTNLKEKLKALLKKHQALKDECAKKDIIISQIQGEKTNTKSLTE